MPFTISIRPLFAAIVVLSVATTLPAQPTPKEAPEETPEAFEALVARHVKPLLDAERVVGGVVGVLRKGKTTVVGFGEFAKGTGDVPDAGSIFEIGSITKTFTSTLLADMTLRGEVALDDPLQSLLPDNIKAPQRGDKPITLALLATHRSGLPRLPNNLQATDAVNPYKTYDEAKLHAFLNTHTPPREPGEYEYSNLGMGLLGHSLASQAGTSYEQLVINRLAEPLAMEDTRITLNDEQLFHFAPPYDGDGNVAHRWDFGCLAGCGALRSTAPDLLKFAAAAMDETNRPASKALRLAFEKQADVGNGQATGLGWAIARDGVTRWHNGQTGGYSSGLFIVPPAKTAVVMLTNTACSDTNTVCERITQAVLGMDVEPVSLQREVQVDAALLQSCVGKYQLSFFSAVTVTLKDGRLHAQLTGQDAYPIYAKSDTKFFYKIVPAEITFDRDDAGVVTKLTLHQNGLNMPAPRIKLPAKKPAAATDTPDRSQEG